jgi:hypothetical protein
MPDAPATISANGNKDFDTNLKQLPCLKSTRGYDFVGKFPYHPSNALWLTRRKASEKNNQKFAVGGSYHDWPD